MNSRRRPRGWYSKPPSNISCNLTFVFVRGCILSVPFVSSFELPRVSINPLYATYARSPCCDVNPRRDHELHKSSRRIQDSHRSSSFDLKAILMSSHRKSSRCVTPLPSTRSRGVDENPFERQPRHTQSNGRATEHSNRVRNQQGQLPGRKARSTKAFEISGNVDKGGTGGGDGLLARESTSMTRRQWSSSMTAVGIISTLMVAGSASDAGATLLEVRNVLEIGSCASSIPSVTLTNARTLWLSWSNAYATRFNLVDWHVSRTQRPFLSSLSRPTYIPPGEI